MKQRFLQKLSLLAIMLMVGVSSVWAGDQYQLINDVSQLEAGKTYIIASGTSGTVAVMKAYSSGNNCAQVSGVSVTDGKITATSEMGILTLGGTTGEWTFNDGTYYLTATNTKSSNYLKGAEDADDYSKFTISFSESTAVITCTGKTSRNIMRYNSSSSLFACYSSGQDNIYLYKKIEGSGTPTYKVNIGTIANGSVTATPAEAEAGTTITLTPTPDEGYVFTSWYVLDGNADEVTVTDDKFTLPASDVEVDATFTALPTHTITVNQAAGGTITANPSGSTYEGKVVSLNAVPNAGYEFESWVVTGATVGSETASSTTFTMGTNDVTITAKYIVSTTVTDIFTQSTLASKTEINNNANTTTYQDWANISYTSKAKYKGNSAFGKEIEYIQLRSNDNNSGIVTTTSGGKAKNITLVWNSGTANGRTINVYGKNTPYSAASDLYNADAKGTLLGTIVYGTSTSLNIDGEYLYIGICSNSGALYLDQLSITWKPKDVEAVEIGETGYATYSTKNYIVIPDAASGVQLFGAKLNDSETGVTLIPTAPGQVYGLKGEGFIVKATPNTTVYIEQTGENGGTIEGNELIGTYDFTKTLTKGEAYILVNKDGVAMFGPCDNGDLPVHKAYLPAPLGAGAKEFLPLDEATGIDKVEVNGQQSTVEGIFNLAGQKVGADYKGIVIVNGKKYLNK